MAIGTLMIRADATPTIGAGHVMRCVALAQAWKRSGGDVLFVSRTSVPLAIVQIQREGFQFEPLNEEPGSRADAASTKSIAETRRPRWIAIDGYHFGADYLHSVRARGSKILLIDDEGRRDSSIVDVVLNQNLHATADMYASPRSSNSLLLGTRFAMLREEFVSAGPEHDRDAPLEATKVLVTFGGGMQPQILDEILSALGMLGTLFEIVVVGHNSSENYDLKFDARIRLPGTVPDMAPLMAWADIAVSAAGSTTWELCRMGVPSVLIDVAENQRPLGRELASRGIAVHIPGEKADGAIVVRTLRDLAADHTRRCEMSERGMQLVDGRGAQRVVAALRACDITLRGATADDAPLLWNWRNDPVVRAASFSGELVSWNEHCAWIRGKLRDPESQIWIAEECGCPLGTVQAKKTSEAGAQLGITVAPEFRGQGLAAFMIRAAAETAIERWGLQELNALIKPQNLSSIRAFAEAGFQLRGVTTVNGCEAARYVQVHCRHENRDYAESVAAEDQL